MSQTLRRTSTAVAGAIQKIDPLTVTTGNPLGLEINEIRRVSSVGFVQPNFNARRYSRAPSSYERLQKPITTESLEESPEEIARGGMSEKVEEYTIQRLAAHDDVELLTTTKRIMYRLCPLLVVATIAAYWIYFALRVRFTLDAQRAAHKTYWMAWAFILVELFVSIPMLLHRLWGWHAVGSRKRPRLRLVGDEVPSVDVVITCCGEDDDLVLDTAKAACNIDYPPKRFRVLICDDGKSKRLQDLVEETALTQFDNLYYRSRPKYPGVPHHFKAGNLNDALEETAKLPGGAANFLAALDADMIPMRDWLRALLPHMLQDPKCSMACPPQVSGASNPYKWVLTKNSVVLQRSQGRPSLPKSGHLRPYFRTHQRLPGRRMVHWIWICSQTCCSKVHWRFQSAPLPRMFAAPVCCWVPDGTRHLCMNHYNSVPFQTRSLAT